MPDLLTATTTDLDPADLVRQHGTVVAEFGHLTQDSGNISWVVDDGTRRVFVKTAGRPGPPPPGAPVPYFGLDDRIALLRNAVEVARSCEHPAMPRLRNVVETPLGPALVYDAVPGELVHTPRPQRDDPASAYQRFAHAPAATLLGVLDTLVDVHVALAAAGWVACDLYDGSLIVDLPTARLWVVDIDGYHRGPFTNQMGRMFGASRFMAPEEHELGATVDERTTVFTLGRLAWHFGTRLTERDKDFCGPPALAGVVRRACRPAPDERYADVAALGAAWRAARG
jgi:serine/threonine-protein kinase